MKKWLLVIAIIILFQNRQEISLFLNPPPDFSAINKEDVVLYATSWCGYCKKARSFLEKYNIPYTEYDIEKSTEGLHQYKQLGGKGVPVFLVKGKTISGYNPQAVVAALEG
ncbi:glutaredoxin family protein [Spartinivicinus poritis]|uniref:Glutaredoxin family protein n=1 Tax=Spartinivicinus poritis TaxID=2994640 RepID=A0ABT5UCH4_9GAMM|nr:glutaredoxin family protein [Spartinivicinus sp. A2-2]MDE1464079.1 glutaredoxin family protein [Spartinivicinus sp. A2-2]